MGIIDLVLISIALAMDAFAISICKGITMKNKIKRNSIVIAISFSIFQMLMPLLGYLFGYYLKDFIIHINNIIAFILLSFIGINMIKTSYEDDNLKIGLSISELFGLSIATSIDALAIGVTFSLFKVDLYLAILLIGITAFIFSLTGVKLGQLVGKKYEKKAQILGGITLILIGLKILLENIFH